MRTVSASSSVPCDSAGERTPCDIAAGAPLDHVNNLHWTALIEAVVLGDGGRRHQSVVRDLLAAGADARLADRSGRTPLTLARERGYLEMVRMLEAAR